MIIWAILLITYLLYTNIKYGIPNMISDTYYQLGNYGYVFSIILSILAIGMNITILNSGFGIQCLAFIGCSSLLFVACAPNYLDQTEYKVHKTGATIAACGSIGWCLSVNIWVTICITILYVVQQLILYLLKRNKHPWYWAEFYAFLDVFVTYLIKIHEQ